MAEAKKTNSDGLFEGQSSYDFDKSFALVPIVPVFSRGNKNLNKNVNL